MSRDQCPFVDEQEAGPYAFWRHTHRFEDQGSSTLMRDLVEYAEPLGALGWVAHVLFVERALHRIFDFRRDAIQRRFGPEAPVDPISSPLHSASVVDPQPPRGGP